MSIRLLDSGYAPGAVNMGIDQAVLEAVARGESPPSLRFYGWAPPCVTIGYFQSMADEVDLAACKSRGVDTVRRITGGGAVFHDAEITYSIILPEGHAFAPSDILESYRSLCEGVVAGLAKLGVSAVFAPINDIVARDQRGGDKKVSGNAQTRKQGFLLQHGTILLDVDVEAMFSLLRVPSEKLKGKLIEDVKARVTGLRALLGREVGYAEAMDALADGFSQIFASCGERLEPGALSSREIEEAGKIARDRFSNPAWNLKR